MAITLINRSQRSGNLLLWFFPTVDTPSEAVEKYMARSGRNMPVAWVPELARAVEYPTQQERAALLDKAVAANRMIDLVDGKYVPRGEDHSHEPATTEGGTFHPGNVDKALHDLLTTVPVTENDKRNAAMLRRDKPDNQREPKQERTPFDRFKGFVVEYEQEPLGHITNGREFGRFVLPDSIGSLSKVTGR